jgi:CelD/BcsL family acetyltransferase involved in cellulose biosynthesis
MTLSFDIHDDVDTLASEWDELADRVSAPPFLRPGWFAAWYQSFGSGRVEIMAAHRGSRLVGVAALERGLVALRSATNWHSPAWAPLAEDAEVLGALAVRMVERAQPWLSLALLEASSDTLEAFRDAARGCRTRIYTLEHSPYIAPRGTFDEFERRLTAKRRSNLRRMWRRLEEQGHVEFEVHEGHHDLGALLEEGFRVEASGWKGKRATAIASARETRTFYTDVAEWARDRGWLRLAFLRLDGHPLAFDFAIEENGAHALLKTGYEAAWRSFAPGVLLRRLMIERAFRTGLDTYEFLGDAVDWKQEWTDVTRELVAFEAFRPGVSGTAGWLLWAYARPAVRRLVRLGRTR